MSYTRTNWKGIPEDNKIAQGLNKLENAVVSGLGDGVGLSLATTRTHEGLVCYPNIVLPDNMFCVMFTQPYFIDTVHDQLFIVLDGVVPDSYRSRFILSYGFLRTEDPHELLIETDTFYNLTEVPAPNKTHMVAILPLKYSTMFMKKGVEMSHLLIRGAIKLLDGNGNIERVIYSSQLHYTKADSELGFDVTDEFYLNSRDYDCYIYGNIHKNTDNEYASPVIPYSGTRFYGIRKIASLASNIAGEDHGMDKQYSIIPWSLADRSNPTICICLRTGDGLYKFGGYATFIPPDVVAKAAITSGQTFLLDGLWYTATANIGSGETVVLGTNAVACEMPVF